MFSDCLMAQLTGISLHSSTKKDDKLKKWDHVFLYRGLKFAFDPPGPYRWSLFSRTVSVRRYVTKEHYTTLVEQKQTTTLPTWELVGHLIHQNCFMLTYIWWESFSGLTYFLDCLCIDRSLQKYFNLPLEIALSLFLRKIWVNFIVITTRKRYPYKEGAHLLLYH